MAQRVSPQADRDGKKYWERIRRESKLADEKNLPFTISKPKKTRPHNTGYICKCGEVLWLTKVTYMVICSSCNQLSKTEELEKVDFTENTNTEVSIPKYKDIEKNPGPFTKNPHRSTERKKWV